MDQSSVMFGRMHQDWLIEIHMQSQCLNWSEYYDDVIAVWAGRRMVMRD